MCKNQKQYGLRSHNILQMLVSRVRAELGQKAFKFAAPSFWNNVQKDLILSELIMMGEFKSILKDPGNSTLGQCDCSEIFTEILLENCTCLCFITGFLPLTLYCILTGYCVHSFVVCDSCICLFVLSVFIVVTIFMLLSWPGHSWKKRFQSEWDFYLVK